MKQFADWLSKQEDVKQISNSNFKLKYNGVPCHLNIMKGISCDEATIRPLSRLDDIGAGAGQFVTRHFFNPESDRKYELIKPLPGVKVGRILKDYGLFVFTEPTTREERMYRFTEDAMTDFPDYFKKVEADTP